MVIMVPRVLLEIQEQQAQVLQAEVQAAQGNRVSLLRIHGRVKMVIMVLRVLLEIQEQQVQVLQVDKQVA
jgi:hypothetical protein